MSKARHLLLRDVPADIRPEKVTVTSSSLKVVWVGGHVSEYDRAWLEERSFSGPSAESRQRRYRRSPPVKWDASSGLARHDFGAIMGEDAALLAWLEDLDARGLTLIRGIPDEASGAEGILSRVGLARSTHYGRTFEVEDKGDPNNPAYTSVTLGLHTDLPYYEYIPGVQFLHCVRQTDKNGGENQARGTVLETKS